MIGSQLVSPKSLEASPVKFCQYKGPQVKRSISSQPTQLSVGTRTKIEQRLYNMHKVYESNRQKLLKQKEQEIDLEMRQKPQISNKSRKLAQKAESKFFNKYQEVMQEQVRQVFINVKEIKRSSTTKPKQQNVKPSIAKQAKQKLKQIQERLQKESLNTEPSETPSPPQRPQSVNSQTSDYHPNIYQNRRYSQQQKKHPCKFIRKRSQSVAKSCLMTQNSDDNSTDATKQSLLEMTVLQRNIIWQNEKQRKIHQQQQKKEAECLKGYTFQPVLYSRVPHKYQNLPIENLANLSKINDGNLLSKKDLENFFSRQSKPQKPVTLTPFIQRVSFECGFDMSRFSK